MKNMCLIYTIYEKLSHSSSDQPSWNGLTQAPGHLSLSSIIFTWRHCPYVTLSSSAPNKQISLKLGTHLNLGPSWEFNSQKMSTPDNSCWQLMKMKINLASWNWAYIPLLECGWNFHLFFFLTTVTSCQKLSKLMTTDDYR